MPYTPCLAVPDVHYDIAFIGKKLETYKFQGKLIQVQVPHLILERLTGLVLDLDHQVFGKDPAD